MFLLLLVSNPALLPDTDNVSSKHTGHGVSVLNNTTLAIGSLQVQARLSVAGATFMWASDYQTTFIRRDPRQGPGALVELYFKITTNGVPRGTPVNLTLQVHDQDGTCLLAVSLRVRSKLTTSNTSRNKEERKQHPRRVEPDRRSRGPRERVLRDRPEQEVERLRQAFEQEHEVRHPALEDPVDRLLQELDREFGGVLREAAALPPSFRPPTSPPHMPSLFASSEVPMFDMELGEASSCLMFPPIPQLQEQPPSWSDLPSFGPPTSPLRVHAGTFVDLAASPAETSPEQFVPDN